MTKTKSNSEIILSSFIAEERKRFPANISESTFFEIYAAQQVLKSNDLSDEEVQLGIVGAGGDGGIDAIYFLINGQLIQDDIEEYEAWKKNIHLDIYIIQAKTSNSFNEEAINKLINSADDLFTIDNNLKKKEFKERYNAELLEIVERIKHAYLKLVAKGITVSFNYFYVSHGSEVHNNVSRLTQKLHNKIKSLFPDSAFSFKFIGASALLEIAKKRPSETIEIKTAGPYLSSDEKSYICLVKLADFYKFIVDEDGGKINRHVFEANVRDYQGDVYVNKEIRESLQMTQGENFWWLNNGITILATKVTPKTSKALLLDSPEIVNGLQTSNEIYNYFSSVTKKTLSKEQRDILIRIIVPSGEKSRDKIIKATNSQTKIPPYSLKSTDPIHWSIEQYLKEKGVFYDRRKNYYKNQNKPKAKIVSIQQLAQAVIAIKMGRPDHARARPSTLLGSEEDYIKIFSPLYHLELYFSVLKTMEKVDTYLSSTELLPRDKTNLRFYVAYYAVSAALQKAYFDNADIISAVEKINDNIIGKSLIIVSKYYKNAGGGDHAAKGPDLLKKIIADKNRKYQNKSTKELVKKT